MNLITKIIMYIYNITNNLGITIIAISFILSLFSIISNYFNYHNQYVKIKYAKDVFLIKKEYDEPEKQLVKINELYKKDRYFYVIPVVLKILISVINIMIFIIIINFKSYINIENINTSFLFIKDIFMPVIDFKIPILCGILSFTGQNIFEPKKNFAKENIKQTLITILLLLLTITGFVIYGNIFGQIYLIYIIGISIFKFISVFLFRKINIKISKYQKEYNEWILSQEKMEIN